MQSNASSASRKIALSKAVTQTVVTTLLAIPLLITSAVAATTDSNKVDAKELAFLRSVAPWPMTPPADPGNELSGLAWAEQLGETLFNDSLFSADGTISCASCHLQEFGFSDRLSVSHGAQKHTRNTQSLLDAGFQRWHGWDGGSDSLWAAALRPMLSPVEMAGDIRNIAYRLRQNPAVTEKLVAAEQTEQNGSEADQALVVRAAKAIAAYTRTLVSARTPFDEYRDAMLSGDSRAAAQYPLSAKRGLKIFISDEANCSTCHFGAVFSNQEFHDTRGLTLSDKGEADAGRLAGIKRLRDDPFNLLGEFNADATKDNAFYTRQLRSQTQNFSQWRTPTLRNLKHTAPYLHNGGAATLRAVVDGYADFDMSRVHVEGESILKPFSLDEQGRQDLVAFLESLSSP